MRALFAICWCVVLILAVSCRKTEPGLNKSGPGPEVVFQDGQVLEYHVTMAPADLEEMKQHGIDEVYRQANLKVTGGTIGEVDVGLVGFRYKGAAGTLWNCWKPATIDEDKDPYVDTLEEAWTRVRLTDEEEPSCAKLSYKIKFDEYDDQTRFFGLKRLNLHGRWGPLDRLREMLAYSTFNDFGVTASRTAPAKVYVNGEYQGFYSAVEEIDGRFTHFRFPEGGDGNLYKEIWPITEGPTPDDYAWYTDTHIREALETNEKAGDITDFLGFVDALRRADLSSFELMMEPWVSVEDLVRYIAVDRATKNWDGIMAIYWWGQGHNMYWYRDNGSERRFHLIPWDLPATFWENDPYMDVDYGVVAEAVPNWNVKPADCTKSYEYCWEGAGKCGSSPSTLIAPGCDKFLNLLAATQWDRFVEIGRELQAGPFKLETLQAKVDAWSALADPAIAEKVDPDYKNVEDWHNDRDHFRNDTLPIIIFQFEEFLKLSYVDQSK